MSPERRRLIWALLFSLLIHGLLLSLRFEDQGLGIPGFGAPWRDRRIEVPDLRVVLVPAQVAVAEPAVSSVVESVRQELIVQPSAGVPAVTPSAAPAPTLRGQSGAIVGKVKPAAKADDATAEAPANEHSRTDAQGGSTPAPVPEQAVIAMEQPVEETFIVPPARLVPTPVTAAAPSASSPVAVQRAAPGPGDTALQRIDQEARERSVERARLERAEQEARRQAEQLAKQREIDAAERSKRDEESARLEADRQEAEAQRMAQQELARRDAAQSEAALQEAARLEAARQEVARVETARLEAARQEAARLQAAGQEAARQEASRVDAARLEAARLEAARQDAAARQEAARERAARDEAARLEAARQEAVRQESARQEAARVESARLEAARQETARQDAARQESARAEEARLEAARQAAARVEAARQEASRLEEARLQLAQRQTEEAARRAAASPAAAPAMVEQGSRSAQQDRADGSRAATTGREPSGSGAPSQAAPPPVAVGQGLPSRVPEASSRAEAQPAARMPVTQATTSSGARRRTLFGHTDPNVDLVMYAEAWRRKIELNMTFDLVREAAKQPHANPLVTVALRSNGTVESVTFNRSSGVAQIDEAVRRIVHSQAPYQAFPPDLAREFDVIEIRRTWMFDMAIRLY